jgi:hypothetical protein
MSPFADVFEMADGMLVQTLVNMYKTTRSQVAGETATNRHMLASHTLRLAFDSYIVRWCTDRAPSVRRTVWSWN